MPRAPCEALSTASRSTRIIPGPLAHEQAAGFLLVLPQVPISTKRTGSCWLQVSRAHLQEDSQQQHGVVFKLDLHPAVEGLPDLAAGTLAGCQTEDPLCGRPVLIEQSQQVLRAQRRRVAGLETGPEVGAGDIPSLEEQVGWDGMETPSQAGLPGWAGAACHPGCRDLPGAGQRELLHQQSPMALVPLPQPRSMAVQMARAASSCSCGSHLLPRETEQRAMEEKHQESAPSLPQCSPPATEGTGEAASFGTEGPRSSALSCRRAMGMDMPCGKGSSSPIAARVPACKNRRERPSCPSLLHTHHPCGHVRLQCRRGRELGAAWHQPARNGLRSPAEPHSRKGPW